MTIVPGLKPYQDRLHRLGLYPEEGDSDWGPKTERALDRALLQLEKTAGIDPPLYPGLPLRYSWLLDLSPLPLIIHEGLKLLGTIEQQGAASSPTIMGWKDELAREGVAVSGYSDDSVAWCGLFVAKVALAAGKAPSQNPLWARNWAQWGEPSPQPSLGDVLVFPRGSGGHVAIYIAEDNAGYFHILGGNQGDAVNIMRKKKQPLLAARRAPYRNKPATVKPYIVEASGAISTKEA